MKLCIFAILVATTVAIPLHLPLSDDIINYVNNNANTTWKAGKTFQGWSISYVKGLCGVIRNPNGDKLKTLKHDLWGTRIPSHFDSREKWTHCPTLKEIRDQGNCGSCWATAAVAAMSDRICIHSHGKKNAHLSIEDLMTCCSSCGMGCNGGFPGAAWSYYEDTGI